MDAVGEDVETHVHVDHAALAVPQAQLMGQLHALLTAHMAADPEFKVRRAAGCRD